MAPGRLTDTQTVILSVSEESLRVGPIVRIGAIRRDSAHALGMTMNESGATVLARGCGTGRLIHALSAGFGFSPRVEVQGTILMKVMPGSDSVKQTSQPVLAADTSPEAQRLQVRIWRRMSPAEKAEVVGQVSSSVCELSLTGIRQRHPSASERECRLRYALLTLGRSLACKAYPEAESLSGH